MMIIDLIPRIKVATNALATLVAPSLPGVMVVAAAQQVPQTNAANDAMALLLNLSGIILSIVGPITVRYLRSMNQEVKKNKSAGEKREEAIKNRFSLMETNIQTLKDDMRKMTIERDVALQQNKVLQAQVEGYKEANLLLVQQLKEEREHNETLMKRVSGQDQKIADLEKRHEQQEQRIAAHQSVEAFATVITAQFRDMIQAIKKATGEQTPVPAPSPTPTS